MTDNLSFVRISWLKEDDAKVLQALGGNLHKHFEIVLTSELHTTGEQSYAEDDMEVLRGKLQEARVEYWGCSLWSGSDSHYSFEFHHIPGDPENEREFPYVDHYTTVMLVDGLPDRRHLLFLARTAPPGCKTTLRNLQRLLAFTTQNTEAATSTRLTDARARLDREHAKRVQREKNT